ncbi:unnamed protein product [Trichobilharzia szidati]|nr:unnamed protein product [Trichobilharzia szidati]
MQHLLEAKKRRDGSSGQQKSSWIEKELTRQSWMGFVDCLLKIIHRWEENSVGPTWKLNRSVVDCLSLYCKILPNTTIHLIDNWNLQLGLIDRDTEIHS